jgi:hypothetical protein
MTILNLAAFLSKSDDPSVWLRIFHQEDKINQKVAAIENFLSHHMVNWENPQIYAHHSISQNFGMRRHKPSNLDAAVMMASLETNKFSDPDSLLFFAPNHPLMRATFHKLQEIFYHKYSINRDAIDPITGEPVRGLAWGRYPEDGDNGGHFGGPPWFITSFAAIQYLLWEAIHMSRTGEVTIHPQDQQYFLTLNPSVTREELGGDLTEPMIVPATTPSGAPNPIFEKIIAGMVKVAKETFFRLMVHTGHGSRLPEIFSGHDGRLPEEGQAVWDLTWSYVEAVKTGRMLMRAAREPHIDLKLEVPSTCMSALSPKVDPVRWDWKRLLRR